MSYIDMEDLPDIDIPDNAAYIARAYVKMTVRNSSTNNYPDVSGHVCFSHLPVALDKDGNCMNVYSAVEATTSLSTDSLELESVRIKDSKPLD